MNHDLTWHPGHIDPADRMVITGGSGMTVWITGLSGGGKSTIAHLTEAHLIERGRAAYTLDGDNIRHGLNEDLGFSAADRSENVRRVGEVARLMADAGLVVFASLISPYRADRDAVRLRHENAGTPYREVFVDTPIEICEERDPKGLYRRARAGQIEGFTGINDPYEQPLDPDLRLDTTISDIPTLVGSLAALIYAETV